jgi:glutathione S-transferase
MSLIGLPYEVVEAPTWEGEAEQAKVAAVNPLKQIPALVTPDGETITESAAILIWLADRYPAARLGPAIDDPARAQFLRWMTFIPASIYSLFWVRDEPSRLGGGPGGPGADQGGDGRADPRLLGDDGEPDLAGAVPAGRRADGAGPLRHGGEPLGASAGAVLRGRAEDGGGGQAGGRGSEVGRVLGGAVPVL